MRFEEMKVAELKQESRNRGLTLESKGHKFTKQELIDRLNAYENEVVEKQPESNNEDNEAWIEVKSETKVEKPVETKEVKTSTDETEERKFATLEEIEMKYGSRKEQRIYDNVLQANVLMKFLVDIHGILMKKC